MLVAIIVSAILGGVAGARWQRIKLFGKSRPRAGTLAIHRATWGPADSEEFKDVTGIVRKQVHRDTRDWINIPIENATFGKDPFPYKGKHFTVVYSITAKKIIDEQPVPNRLILPES
jgi:hypothetical protein